MPISLSLVERILVYFCESNDLVNHYCMSQCICKLQSISITVPSILLRKLLSQLLFCNPQILNVLLFFTMMHLIGLLVLSNVSIFRMEFNPLAFLSHKLTSKLVWEPTTALGIKCT